MNNKMTLREASDSRIFGNTSSRIINALCSSSIFGNMNLDYYSRVSDLYFLNGHDFLNARNLGTKSARELTAYLDSNPCKIKMRYLPIEILIKENEAQWISNQLLLIFIGAYSISIGVYLKLIGAHWIFNMPDSNFNTAQLNSIKDQLILNKNSVEFTRNNYGKHQGCYTLRFKNVLRTEFKYDIGQYITITKPTIKYKPVIASIVEEDILNLYEKAYYIDPAGLCYGHLVFNKETSNIYLGSKRKAVYGIGNATINAKIYYLVQEDLPKMLAMHDVYIITIKPKAGFGLSHCIVNITNIAYYEREVCKLC